MRFRPARILCATDLSEGSRFAITYAAALARKFNGKLLLCHVADLTPARMYESAGLVLAAIREIQRTARAEIRRLMMGEDVDWEPLVLEGDPSSRIVQIAEERDIDLVVGATHGRKGLRRLLVGSVTHQILHALQRPFLIVHNLGQEPPSAAAREVRIRKILVGCDFSPDSELAVQYAASLAQEFQAELCLLHVLEPYAYENLNTTTEAIVEDLRRAVRSAIEERLSRLVEAGAKDWAQIRPAIASGKPSEEITKFALDEAVDVIVVGSRGLGLVGRLLIGSEAERVVRLAPCPVLVVRPPGPR